MLGETRRMLRFSATVYVINENPQENFAIEKSLAGTGMQVEGYFDSTTFFRHFSPEKASVIITGGCKEGIAALEKLHSMGAKRPAIVVSSQSTVAQCVHAFKNGALEYFETPVGAGQLLNAVRTSLAGYINSKYTSNQDKLARERFKQLSDREREVVGMIIDGMKSREIAHALGVSKRTVDVHRMHLAEKLQTKTVAHLVKIYAPLISTANG
jgi:FixJ family two-component response regulator